MLFPKIISDSKPADEEYDLPAGVKVLDANDRCDGPSCTSQARSVVVLESNAQLLFCRHHTEVNRAALEERGATIYTQYKGL